MPTVPGDQRTFNTICEKHALPFVSQLWALDLIHYRTDGNIVISRKNVIAAAVQFMIESKDCRYSESFEVDCFNESRQCFYTPDNARKALINHKGYQAQAILTAAYLSGTRLTDAQRKWLESAANGRYLDDKYAQYKSGTAGTLAPKIDERGHGLLSMGDYARYMRDVHRAEFIEAVNPSKVGLNRQFVTPVLTL